MTKVEVFSVEQGEERRFFNCKNKTRICIALLALVLVAVMLAILIWVYIGKGLDGTQAKKNTTASDLWSNIRLPRSSIPVSYDIQLDVDMKNESYHGKVNILFRVVATTQLVVFHGKNLKVSQAEIVKGGVKIKTETLLYNALYEQYVIQVKKTLPKDNTYELKITFSNVLGRNLHGFYMSKFDDSKGKTHKVAMTFFSPVSARMAIPCFDEPNMKANFTLTISHQEGYHALANMPAKNTSSHKDRVTTQFEPSIKMSTYILCWLISDFKSLNRTLGDLIIKTWASEEEVQNTEYGMNVSLQLLSHYESYFGIKFPLKKLDIAAVPEFGAGAMENWGLITYRKARFLYNPSKTSSVVKQRILNIISHELTHQWFGNLATMDYWIEAWLKEGKNCSDFNKRHR